MKKKRRSVKMNVFLSLVLVISLFSTSTASAAYYNTYTTKTLINNSTYTMGEGFAVGSTSMPTLQNLTAAEARQS